MGGAVVEGGTNRCVPEFCAGERENFPEFTLLLSLVLEELVKKEEEEELLLLRPELVVFLGE